MRVQAVSPVGIGSCILNSELISKYEKLNKELRAKRLGKTDAAESISYFSPSGIKSNLSDFTPEELRKMYANPLTAKTPVKIAYTIIQRLCNDF